jgi:chloramphenicol 3-O-phosphotransferase
MTVTTACTKSDRPRWGLLDGGYGVVMLVWLQGGPSSGKSSIARRMLARAQVGEAWFLTGDQHVTTSVPRRLITPRQLGAEEAIDGWDIPLVDRTLVARPRAGPVALRILDGMYRSAAAMTGAGVHVILDDVVWERAVLELARRALTGVSLLVVEVRCELNVALQRERNRGDRYPGAVDAYASESPLITHPDARIDTTARTAAVCADELVEIVRKRDRA